MENIFVCGWIMGEVFGLIFRTFARGVYFLKVDYYIKDALNADVSF